MRKLGPWLAAVAFLASAAPLVADEPYLEMIRGLRAAGEPELALEYMQERIPKNLPPELAQVIGLELARTRVEIARAESEEGKRLALFNAARTEFQNFLAKNPKHELAPQALFEIARLTAAQGKEQVNRARRAQGDVRTRAYKDAQPLFETAITQLRDAGKLLNAQRQALGDPQSPVQKAMLREQTQSWLQAQLEEGQNLFQLGKTYEDQKKTGEKITEGIKVFDKLSNQVQQHPTCWMARAWMARCYVEIDDFPKATEHFEVLRGARGPETEDAKRAADYYRVLMGRTNGSPNPMNLTQQQTALTGWLDRHRAYLRTPEGCGVRFTLADVLEKQALSIKGGVEVNEKGRPIKVTPEAAALLKQSERLLRTLTEFENDFSDQAAAKRMRLILAITIKEAQDRDPAKVNNFESAYMLALLEVAELNEELKDPTIADDPEKVVESRKQHYGRAVKALDRAMKLVQPTDPPKEVADARVMQVFANYIAGNSHAAALLGEYLAKQLTRTSRGAVPALYSLQAYRNVMIETKAAGAARDAELQTDREQVRRMATFMEATWPNDTPTDTARHTLGSLYFSDGDFVKALETYARVTPNYISLAFLRNEQGIACFNLQRDAKVPAPVRKQWFDGIIAVLAGMPDLGRGADADIAYAYCLARLQLGNLLRYEGKQYPRMEQLGKEIMAQSASYTIDKQRSDEIKYNAQALMIYGLNGRIYELVKAHNLTEAAKLYMPALAELQKTPLPEDESAARARKAAADLLLLALKASVQEGDIDRAQSLLKQLQQVSGGKDSANASAPLVAVLREVQAQIADLRKTDPMRLEDTLGKFRTFLDALAKQPNLGRDVKIFLAQGFASLDQPDRAIELITSIPVPTEKHPGAPPADNADDAAKTSYDSAKAAYDAAWKPYWFAQLTHVRILRQAGRQAKDAAEKAKFFGPAETLLNEMIGTPQKQGWAFNSLEVRRERIFLLEDRMKWADAMAAWTQMQKPFAKFSIPPKDDKETRTRAAYYEVRFYMMRLVGKSKQNLKDTQKKAADLKRLAEQIVDMEKDARTSDFGGAAVKKLFEDWLSDEPEMRKAYESVGGKALLPGGDAAQ